VPSQPLPSQPLPNPSSSHPLSSGPPPESAPRLPVERFASGQVPPEASGSALDAQAYAAFQETMRQFLLTQETVLEQLFRGPDHSAPPERSDVWPSSLGLSHRPSFAPPAPVVPHPQHTTNGAEYAFVSRVASEPSAAATPLASAGAEFAISAITTDGAAAADLQPAASAEPPHATAAPSQAETRDTHPRAVNSRAAAAPVDPPALANRLIEVVADRTGYPVEMLNLDTNLEGELGIDSIKRVEIIAAFRRDVLPQSQEPPAEFMERLTAAKTLRAIVDIVTEMLGGSAAPAAHTSAAPLSEPGEPAAGANSLDLDDLLATLVRIVAERTGYPVEMLDLDTNLEGELGIDSIKRVEIIAAFRREILPQLHEPPAEFMERLTAAKSMRVIVVAVAELLGLAADGAATPASAAAVSSASTPSWDAEDLTATLVRIVADRTGYPLEMLELETNLEGELGIDSIKRVEIIAAFRREVLPQLQEPPADFMERLTASKTMRAILDCFTTMLVGVTPGPRPAHASAVTHAASSAQAAVVSDASPAAKQNGARCPRCLAAMVETPLGPRDAISAGVYLLTADEAGVSAGVERLLTAAGATVARLSDADLRSRDTAAARVQAIRNEQGPIAGVLHLAPLSAAPAFPNVERSVWENALEREVLGLLFVLQAIEPELAKGESAAVRVLCGTLGGGDFDAAAELEAAHPWRGALAGLLKVAAKEWPQARFRLADFVEAPNPQSLLEELAAAGPVEIGYRGGRRLAIEMRPVELPDAAAGPGASRLTADSVVLVTGGAKGITAELVREMAVHTQATFVLLGRSAAPVHEEAAATAAIAGDAALRSAIIAHLRAGANACTPALVEAKLSEIKSGREIRRTLRAIEQVGGKVHYRSCDLRDADALPRCIAQIVAEFGPIEALVHGAGIIEDRAIMDKTAESFHRVVATKVQPVVTLLSLLDQLKVVALFASSSGVFGNAGQCDYAAANEILNRIARRWARSSGAKVVSYNWGPWAGVGMVTPEVARKMAAQGIALIEPAAGREAAWREIATSHAGSPRVILGAGPWLNAAVSPNNDSLRAAGPRAAAVPLRRETPLLAGQAVERRADGSIVARVLLDRRQPALADHCIDGKAVMPVMLGLALMAEVAQAGQPEWQVTTVEDLRMQAGISLTNARRELILHAERTSSAAAESAWRVRITTAETGVRVLYQATVQLAPGYPPAPDRLPVERIATAWETPAEKLYDEWLFHGPLYQAIQSFVGANAQGIDAIVQPSDAGQFMNRPQDQAASAARWLVDPVVLDVAPQLGIVWARRTHDVAMLPNRVARFHIYEPFGAEPLETLFRIQPGSDAEVFRADVYFVRAGRLLAQLQGLEGAGSQQLNRKLVSSEV
jgi:NAD(P)-dependent dehydrogenase (short-subunit alcohol dehydrogenase family)/acyl carrier protein